MLSLGWPAIGSGISVAATAAFAVTAVFAIGKDRDIEPIGALFLGMATAVGGGTIRDVILDVPVFWSTDLSCIWVAAVSSLAALSGRKLFSARHLYNLVL